MIGIIDHDVKLCPRCYLRGRLQRLCGRTLALPCLGCGRVYTPTDYTVARTEAHIELTHRLNTYAHKEIEDVGAVAI